jgi:predicted glycoside hydrolase/deacetylase ChbG (UPF0249 family)
MSEDKSDGDDTADLATRKGLPEDQLFMARQYPQNQWLTGQQVSELGRFWLAIHRSFRVHSLEVQNRIEALLNGKAELEATLGPFEHGMGQLLSHLEGHHQIEDYNYFPQFVRIEPRLARGFEIMDADHHVIHDGMVSLAHKSREFIMAGSVATPDHSAVERAANELQTAVATFRRHMLRHLDDEEDLVIPLIIDRKLG